MPAMGERQRRDALGGKDAMLVASYVRVRRRALGNAEARDPPPWARVQRLASSTPATGALRPGNEASDGDALGGEEVL